MTIRQHLLTQNATWGDDGILFYLRRKFDFVCLKQSKSTLSFFKPFKRYFFAFSMISRVVTPLYMAHSAKFQLRTISHSAEFQHCAMPHSLELKKKF
jgi:hypothetical protein